MELLKCGPNSEVVIFLCILFQTKHFTETGSSSSNIFIHHSSIYGTVSSILLLNTDLAVAPLSLASLGILAL